MRIGGWLFAVATVMVLAGCGVSDEKTVSGTVERVGVENQSAFQSGKRFITLEGDDTVYECWLEKVQRCAVLEEGDEVTLVAGHDKVLLDEDVDNFVTSIEITSD